MVDSPYQCNGDENIRAATTVLLGSSLIPSTGGNNLLVRGECSDFSSSIAVFCLHSFLCSVHIWHVHALFGDSLFIL